MSRDMGQKKAMNYPLVNVYITNWKINIFNGKNHYKWQFSIAMLVYQRVYPLSSLKLQAQVGYQWIQMCFLLGLLIYIPQMVNTFKTYPLIQHLGSCFISRPLTRVHGHCRHIYIYSWVYDGL